MNMREYLHKDNILIIFLCIGNGLKKCFPILYGARVHLHHLLNAAVFANVVIIMHAKLGNSRFKFRIFNLTISNDS